MPCLSCHARFGKLSAGPPIAAFDLRRLKNGNTPCIRVTQQAESVVGGGGDIRIVMEHTGMYWRPIALALKEPRSVHRENIASVASQLFAERGISSTSMDDIAKAAGYSKATQHHFHVGGCYRD